MGQHLLIAVATSVYPNLAPRDSRPQLKGILASVVGLFTKTIGGYRQELCAIADNPTSDVLRKSLDAWFASGDRDPKDWVVFYYTGHAEVVGADELFLLTSDFVPPEYVGTAFSLQQLAAIVLAKRSGPEPRRVNNLLVIIDTCFAGEGTTELAWRLADTFRRSTGSSFHVLGAALPRQEAYSGELARALIQAIGDLSRRHVMQRWLYFDQIVPAINQRLCAQNAVWCAAVSAQEEPQFFPNPSFVDTAGSPVQADEAQRAIVDQEFREHWGPRARGVEFDAQPGSYFSGRDAVLAKLISFLAAKHAGGAAVVTGRPGAGKSAILSRLITLAFPAESPKVLPVNERIAVPRLDLVLHAKGKRLADVTARFAQLLAVDASPGAILTRIGSSNTVTRIIVDALDEAVEPSAIARELLAPLGAMTSVRLIVGTRDSHAASLGSAEVIDIDKPEYAPKEDIKQYVRARLLRDSEPGKQTPYAGLDRLATDVAEAVTARVYPNFLVARLVVEDLLSRPRPANLESPIDMDFPSKVDGAFDAYLARFGASEVTVRDLLLPLAYAEGQGLPWDNIWATIASELSARPYGDDDIRWLLANAGAFVLETVEHGRSVYRLYHQALADALRRGRRMRRMHARISRALTLSVPRDFARSGPDWFTASAYVRTHLATHAAKGGMLGALLNDPRYLLAANPDRLLPAIASRRGKVPLNIVALYEAVVDHIRSETPGHAASYLEMSARQVGLDAVADRAAELPVERLWRTRWARWRPAVPSRSFGKGPSKIVVLVAAVWSRRSVALVGRSDGTVEVWDSGLGERLSYWKPEGVGSTSALALADSEEDPLLIAAWSSGHLGVLHLSTGKTMLRLDDALEAGAILAICLSERGAQRVCVTAHHDRRLVIRDLPNLVPIITVPNATGGRVYGLRTVHAGPGSALLSIGDSLLAEKDALDASKMRLWSLEDLSVTWEDDRAQLGVFQNSELANVLGRRIAVMSQNYWGPVELWDLERRVLLLKGEAISEHAWVHLLGDEPVLIEIRHGELIARRLSAGVTSDDSTWHALGEPTPVEIAGHQFTSITQLHGRSVILGAVGGQIRVWDLEDRIVESLKARTAEDARSRASRANVTSLAWMATNPDEVLVGTFGRVFALEAQTGRIAWERDLGPPSEPDDRVNELAAAPGNRLVAGTAGGKLHVIDRTAPAATMVVDTKTWIERVRVAGWKDSILAFTSNQDARVWSIRVWDLIAGKELPTLSAYRLWMGEEDKRMQGLALLEGDDSIRLAFASKYGKVMVAEFTGPIGNPSKGYHYKEWHIPRTEEEYVTALDAGIADGEALLVAGTEYGALAVWDFRTGTLLAHRPAVHRNGVSAVRIGNNGSLPVVATCGAAGVVHLWTTRLEEIVAIEVGEPIATLAWVGPGQLAVGGYRGILMFDVAPQQGRPTGADSSLMPRPNSASH